MSRFLPSFSPTRFFRFYNAPVVAISLASLAFGTGTAARADEFSVLSPNDPIVRQLGQIAPKMVPGSKTASASLTRYEAALQTARVILDAQNREARTVSRAKWRAIDALCISLQTELSQLGVDVAATRALAAKNLKSGGKTGDATQTPLRARVSLATSAKPATVTLNAISRGAAASTTLLTPELVTKNSAATLANSGAGNLGGSGAKSVNGALQMQLLPGLRVATGLQSARAGNALSEGEARFAPGLGLRAAPESLESRAAQTALSYDLGRYLTLRAANSRLNWNGLAGGNGENPLLGAPVFAGARGARGTGGGVDLNLGAGLKFSTEIEKLRADTGASASRIGGGASLSAFQDRLLLQMSLSRLLPGDKNALTTTAAQVGASLDVSPRLSLNLRYQGLFAPTPNISAARVAGGVSLSF